MNDEELMRDYQRGSEEAFNLLYTKYTPMVYGYVKKRLRPSEADDFFQKIWRQLHEKRELYKDQPFAPWFFVLIKNLLIDEYRSLGRRKEQHQSEFLEKLYGGVNESHDVTEILAHLPPQTAYLVQKYYIEGVGYEELEKETGLSQTNLRQRLSRALRGLKDKLRGQDEE